MSVSDYEAEISEDTYAEYERILERVRPVLGDTAVDRFFDATEAMEPHTRTIAFGHLALISDMIAPYIPADDEESEQEAVIVDLPVHAEIELKQEIDQAGVVELPLVEDMPVQTPEVVHQKPPLNQYVPKAVADIFGQLPDGLTIDDAGTLSAVLIKLRGPVIERKSGSVDAAFRFGKLFTGAKPRDIVELEGNGSAPPTVGVWLANYKKAIAKSYTPEEAYAALEAEVMKSEQATDKKLVDDHELQEAESIDEAIQVQDPTDLTPEQTEALFDDLMERFGRQFTQEQVNGLKLALSFSDGNHRKYRAEITPGRNAIQGLLEDFAPDSHGLIVTKGQGWAKEPHKYLRYLSGYQLKNRDMPRPLEPIAMLFRQTKEKVRSDSLVLLDYLLKEKENSDASQVTPTNTSVKPHGERRDAQPNKPLVASPEHQAFESLDMFAVATGEQQVDATTWDKGVNNLFDRLKAEQKLTATQVACIKDRLYQRGTQRELTEDIRESIKPLKELFGSISPRLAAQDSMLELLRMFVYSTQGHLPIEDMALRRKSAGHTQKNASLHRVEREFIGGFSELLRMNEAR